MRACILMHTKPQKNGNGLLTLLKAMMPHFKKAGYHIDIIANKTKIGNHANWLKEETFIQVPRSHKPFNTLMFGMKQTDLSNFYENIDLIHAMFDRMGKVHYDFVFCMGSNGFHLISQYGVNKHLPFWCDLNLSAWESGTEDEYRFLYGLKNVWVSAHFKIEKLLRNKWEVANFFPTTYPMDMTEEPLPFDETKQKICLIGNKRANHKTPNIGAVDEYLNGELVWLSGMKNTPTLEHGVVHGYFESYEEYKQTIKECRFGLSIAKHECLGIAILEQALVQPVFIRTYGDWKQEWTRIHEVLPTFKDLHELNDLMRHYGKQENWEAQVQKQREYIAKNFNDDVLSDCVASFLKGIRRVPIPNTAELKKPMTVEEILASKGWSDGVSALSHFNKMKAMGIRTVETDNATYFTNDDNFVATNDTISEDTWEEIF